MLGNALEKNESDIANIVKKLHNFMRKTKNYIKKTEMTLKRYIQISQRKENKRKACWACGCISWTYFVKSWTTFVPPWKIRMMS